MSREEMHNKVDMIICQHGYRQKLDGAMIAKIINCIEEPLKAENAELVKSVKESKRDRQLIQSWMEKNNLIDDFALFCEQW